MSGRFAAAVRVLADARRLPEGSAVRFALTVDGVSRDAFALRWKGVPRGYLNTCRHQALPLDFGDAHFLDEAADAIVCCHHGARYRPDTGECVEGPCRGKSLTRLRLEERDGELWCVDVEPPR